MVEGDKLLLVVKRDGSQQKISPEKIANRLRRLCYGLHEESIDIDQITTKVMEGLFADVTTSQLDTLTAEICASMTTKHYEYDILAARVFVSHLHKETPWKFSEVMEDLYSHINPKSNKHSPIISHELIEIVRRNRDRVDSAIIIERDFDLSYIGLKTLEKSYLLRRGKKVLERPQHMFMRVSLGIHGEDLEAAFETYKLMSEKCFIHASATLFNAGTVRPQMCSCFLLTMKDDSIEGIYDTLKECALISKSGSGLGLSVHNIRSKGTFVAGTNGVTNGLVSMLRVFNTTSRYVDQGGNKRPGAFTVYLEPWHPELLEFIGLRKNTGADEIRSRDLFLALWIPDLFMRRVEAGDLWTFMDPSECPKLADCWGEEFEALYEKYESEGRGRRTLPAQEVWHCIIECQIETGNPFMLYKDSCNRKSNHQHLGTIKGSNLCAEIIEYSSASETAVCTLASISLPNFVDANARVFDFARLQHITELVTRNLDKIIDKTFYPVEEARRSNMRHRPIGIGVQGLSDVFVLMRYPFDSPEARSLNKRIFETIYFAALSASCELAERHGPFESYAGCPVSRGVLQPDMWGVDTEELAATSGLDWRGLRRRIREFGVRNSLLLAPMLTASSSQILGNTEATEPLTSNVYSRRAFSGDFQMVNSHLLRDLIGLGVWSEQLKTAIVANQGSIQEIEGIPDDIKALYKTVWEIPQKVILDMAADRGPFIDQSQTLNLYLREPTYGKVTSMHFYAWKRGLKTGMYYLRTRPAAEPIQFTVNNREVSVLLARGFGRAVSLDDERPPDAQTVRAPAVVAEAYRRNLEVLDCSAETANCCLNCSS